MACFFHHMGYFFKHYMTNLDAQNEEEQSQQSDDSINQSSVAMSSNSESDSITSDSDTLTSDDFARATKTKTTLR